LKNPKNWSIIIGRGKRTAGSSELQEERAQMTHEEKYQYMTETPVPKLICKLAVPTIISMLITNFYNMADTYFVGKINTSSSGAVGIVFSLMAIIQAFGFFFGQGSGNYMSRKLGEHKVEQASKMSALGFFSSLFFGLLITVFGLLFLEPFARLLGATDTILPYAKDYLQYILIGAPYMTAALCLNVQLRFQGSAVYGMIGILFGAILNIALDPLFIFTFDMGVGGAALATIISQFVSFVLLLICSYRGGNIAIRLRNFRPSLLYFKEMLQGGLPSLCRQSLISIATMVLNHSAGIYGDAAIAAMGIVNRVFAFAYSALVGFGHGFQPVCGFNYGARLYGRVRQAFWFCIKSTFGFLVVLAVVGYFFAPEIVMQFRKEDPDVILIGAQALQFQCFVFPLMSFNSFTSMMLQAIRRTTRATVLAMARQGIFFLPALLILPQVLGLTGIQLAQPTADFCTAMLAIPLAISELSKMKAAEAAALL